MQKKSKGKTIAIIVLCAVFIVESVALVFISKSKQKDPARTVRTENSAVTLQENPYHADPNGLLVKIIGMIAGETSGEDFDIGATIRGLICTNSIVNTLMRIVYPMLYDSIKNDIGHAQSIHLFGTGPLLAKQISQQPNGHNYTIVDKDGERKPLIDVLQSVGSDWSYMATEVTWTDASGAEKTTDLYDTIDWNVTDVPSFYSALTDMSLGFRGLLEITLQDVEGTITVSLPYEIAKYEGLPITLDVAKIYNDNDKSGYELGIIYLYNLLGLDEGEYPSVEEFCNYSTVGEVFKSLIETVIYAVEKLLVDPMQGITNLLLNLVDGIDSGELVKHFSAMHMVSEFTDLAKMIGNSDSEMFNLGTTLLNVINDMGIPVYGNFNDLVEGAVHKFLDENAAVPKLNVNKFLATGTPRTAASGNRVYTADPEATLGYLVKYLLQGDMLGAMLGKIGIFDEAGIAEITTAFNQSRKGVCSLVKSVLIIVLRNL